MSAVIQLGMTRQQVRSIAGPPVRVDEAKAGDIEVWRYRRPGQRLLRLRTTWVDFEFRDGVLTGDRVSRDSWRGVLSWCGKAILLGVAAVGILTISRVAADRYEGQRLRTARAALRPGLTTAEVGELFKRRGGSSPRDDGTGSWIVTGRSVDRVIGDLYVVDGEFVRSPANTKTELWIDFKNGEVVAWSDLDGS